MFKEKDYNKNNIVKGSNLILEKLIFLLFIAHGVAHLVGLFIYWKIMPGTEDTPYKTKVFFSELEIGTFGVAILGLIYLVLAVMFITLGILLIVNKIHFNDSIILGLLLFSLMITIIDLMPTIIGLFVNILYLALYLLNKKINFI